MPRRGFAPLFLFLVFGSITLGIVSVFFVFKKQDKLFLPSQIPVISAPTSPTPIATNNQTTTDLEQYKGLINEGEIIFIRNSQLFILDTESMKVTQFKPGTFKDYSDIGVSSDGRLFFFDGEGLPGIYNFDTSTYKMLTHP